MAALQELLFCLVLLTSLNPVEASGEFFGASIQGFIISMIVIFLLLSSFVYGFCIHKPKPNVMHRSAPLATHVQRRRLCDARPPTMFRQLTHQPCALPLFSSQTSGDAA